MNLLQQLRQATRSAHRALDQHPRLAGLVRGGLDMNRYVEALRGLHGAFDVLETAAVLSATVDAYPYQPRCSLLAQDLRQLGSPASSGVADPFPVPRTAAARIGLLYVLEGSLLGGQVIARNVRRCLGDAVPCAFFGQLTEDEAEARWAAFTRYALAGQCSDESVADRAIAAARAAFATCQFELDRSLSSLPAAVSA
jgi:heme oxygenase